jgi:hypothetical protein
MNLTLSASGKLVSKVALVPEILIGPSPALGHHWVTLIVCA